MTQRMDFGSAFEQHDGWTSVDRIDYRFNIVADVLDGLPFPDEHFDMITSHHSLQCIRFDDLPRALAELRRVLKVGGVLRISVPDASRAIELISSGEASVLPISDEIEATNSGKGLRYLFWHGDARSAFDYESLTDTLRRHGFQNVQMCRFKQTHSEYPEIVELDSREAESLICEATK